MESNPKLMAKSKISISQYTEFFKTRGSKRKPLCNESTYIHAGVHAHMNTCL